MALALHSSAIHHDEASITGCFTGCRATLYLISAARPRAKRHHLSPCQRTPLPWELHIPIDSAAPHAPCLRSWQRRHFMRLSSVIPPSLSSQILCQRWSCVSQILMVAHRIYRSNETWQCRGWLLRAVSLWQVDGYAEDVYNNMS